MMAFTIDPPPRFAPKKEWQRYLDRLRSMPQDDWVRLVIKDAERIIAQARDDPSVQTEIRHAERALRGRRRGSRPSRSHREQLPVNRWPLNQDAKKRLLEAGEPPEPNLPFLVQLLSAGFERGLGIPGPAQKYRVELEQASAELLDPRLDPAKVMRWFLSNPNGPEPGEQNDSLRLLLEKASSWQEAAQNLMEWFYDRKAAQDPYYR
jgi:hypothetical protein